MDYIDLKYSRLVSSYLTGWKEVSRTVQAFRCPYCGDSNKSKSKTRGYFYEFEGECMYKCHNCGASQGLLKFLKEISPALATDYIFERFKTKGDGNGSALAENMFATDMRGLKQIKVSLLDETCVRAKTLSDDHHALKYLRGRLIPEDQIARLYYCTDVTKIADQLPEYKDREAQIPKKDAIIIPFIDDKDNLMYLQCRFFSEEFRYLTMQVDENGMKLWGLDRIDWSKDVYVCEGPFDAMFLDNCCAVAGASIMSIVKYIRDRAKKDVVLIFDKDYRTNYEVHSQMIKAVEAGNKIVIYDNQFEAKDLNAYIEDGHTKSQLRDYVETRTFSGLMAKLELTKIRQPKKRKYGEAKTQQKSRAFKPHF